MLAVVYVAVAAFVLPSSLMRPTAPRCATLAAISPVDEFDATLSDIIREAKTCGSMDGAVDAMLDRLDDNFIPELGARITEPTESDKKVLPQMNELMQTLQSRSQERFERSRDQLQMLLAAGEINKMDAQLSALVRKGEIDAGFFYVLLRNLEDAQRDGDEGGARLMAHIHTRLQELIEGQAAPALALLHKLTRMEQASVRLNLLRHNLVPQTSTSLPDGREIKLDTPAPAAVTPMDFAAAIEEALDKVRVASALYPSTVACLYSTACSHGWPFDATAPRVVHTYTPAQGAATHASMPLSLSFASVPGRCLR